MTLAAGTRLGSYEITAKLGEGGMGEVWRARDSQLGRDVALKVLPEGFTSDPERLARFEREAKLLAQLNHPNIAQIYGFEASGDNRALVMELVDGPTLAERLEQGPLPFNESLSISLQMAQALEEAHEKGIVHRDLKPQNVKASIEGKVKVLDFGLAKAMDPVGAASGGASASQLAQSPTLTLGGTQMGVILGTAAYMAPEQAKGLPVDKRADIWAFGVVLYEMLSGIHLFGGDSVPETLAGVLRNEIDLGVLPAGTPPAVRRLVRRCLERNPKNRLHDIADARIVLEEVAAGRADEAPSNVGGAPAALAAPARSVASRVVPWIAGVVLGAIAVALVDRTLLRPAPYVPPSLVSLTYSGRDIAPAASPDGKTIAFTSTRDGRSRIWVKQLATGEEVALTSGPFDSVPSFAPDGSTLLFLRGASPPLALHRVSSVGGEPRRITDGVTSWAGFSPDGSRIALTRSTAPNALLPDILVTLSAQGGEERELARPTDVTIYSVRWRPDGGAIGAWTQLRTNIAAQQSIVEFDAESGARRTIYQPGGGVQISGWDWSGPDAIVVSESVSQSGRGGSRLLRVDRRSGEVVPLISLRQASSVLDVAGPGRVVVDQVALTTNLAEVAVEPGARPAVGGGGSEPWHRLTRGANVDRQPYYSPDGRRVVFNSDRSGNLDLWELELESGAVRPLTDSPADDWDPAYTPDGKHLLWSSNRSGNYEVWIAAPDGSGARQLTRDGVDAENPTATPDGQWIVYVSANPAQSGVWKIHVDGSGAELLVPGTITVPDLSSDGRWISFIDLDRNVLAVVALADGAKIAEIELPTSLFSTLQTGRSRWLPGSPTLAWIEVDPQTTSTRLFAQEIAAGRDTSATRRVIVSGTGDEAPESFVFSPDGTKLLLAVSQPRSELLLIDGLQGVAP